MTMCRLSPNLRQEVQNLLTRVKLEAFLYIRVAAAPSLVVLLQHQHPLAQFGQRSCRRHATDATPDHDGIQVLGNLFSPEAYRNKSLEWVTVTGTQKI